MTLGLSTMYATPEVVFVTWFFVSDVFSHWVSNMATKKQIQSFVLLFYFLMEVDASTCP